MFVAFLLSTRMQRLISEPILALARFAKVVAEEKDYSVRAQRIGRDEVGTLTDAFNTMLGRIHEDAASLRSINHNLKCEITERERTEAALRSSELRFRSVTQSASDAIVSTDTRGRIIFWNKGAERIFGFEEGEILGESILHLLRELLHKSYQEHVERVQADGSSGGAGRTIEMEGVKKNGEAFPFELSLSSWRAGEAIFFSSIIRDITERKRAEAELAALNKQLQDTSRQAGMAEVATAVLHNVGNVLNSVNVSATLIGDRIHASKVTSVTRVASLLQEPGRDVVAFLTTDPRGQKVPGYLAMLAQQLRTEQAELLQEVASLRKNVDHIKEIVAMQQSYAKVSGVVEDLAAAELVEDALRMDAAGLARQDIRLVRDYAEVPTVAVDRHKTVQILVNLIRNARQALSESPSLDRTLTLRIASAGSDRVRLEIIDTGVGIAPENLTNIFRHGFTTKKNGHGFGLHSGANAAREMGGFLHACSAGIGCGATFSLELPAQTARPDAHAA